LKFEEALAAISENLRFFTRLPIGRSEQPPAFGRIAWAAPISGAIVGAFGATALLISHQLGFPAMVSATIAVSVEVVLTGALHEDGLADVFDGFGGGNDPKTKLAIMRDSRIGAYGAIALFLILLMRVEAIGALTPPRASFAAAAVVLGAAAARAAALAPLAWALPARNDGAGASAGSLGTAALRSAAVVHLLLATLLGLTSLGIVRAIFACIVGAVCVRLFIILAQRQIGGQTGDVCGASAGLAQVIVLLALLLGGHHA
jgi:adenosylcobinamide-GDP ribazoletransferase